MRKIRCGRYVWIVFIINCLKNIFPDITARKSGPRELDEAGAESFRTNSVRIGQTVRMRLYFPTDVCLARVFDP